MVTTGGTNAGVMKLVGKAMKNYSLTRIQTKQNAVMVGGKEGISKRSSQLVTSLNVASLGFDKKNDNNSNNGCDQMDVMLGHLESLRKTVF